ncbi:substrate-binding domain-containing protein [Bradyrhizobium sp. UFLA06-06]
MQGACDEACPIDPHEFADEVCACCPSGEYQCRAVAANFTEPDKEIAAAFKQKPGDEPVMCFGASERFYNLITPGAPLQVLLPAEPHHIHDQHARDVRNALHNPSGVTSIRRD